MSSLRKHEAAEQGLPIDAAAFPEMIRDKPREERRQLVEGRPFVMMTPPTITHQRIAYNLAARLNSALEAARPDLFTLLEIGPMIEGRADFRPIADLAVIDADATRGSYAAPFYLVGEVLSPSDTPEQVNAKKEFYASAPECIHVLILGQDERVAEVWSRSHDWQGRVYRSAADRVDLPEFGFSCWLSDLDRGTDLA